MPRTNRYGFTLTELLVVTSIIGILVALLLPVLAQSKRKAQQIQCIGNLHQQGVALQSFVADNHAYPCYFTGVNSDNPGSWMEQLKRGGFDVSKPERNFYTEGVWLCPSARWGSWFHLGMDPPHCYGYNLFGVEPKAKINFVSTDALGFRGCYVSRWEMFAPVTEFGVRVPSAMMAIGDGFEGGPTLYREADLNYLQIRGFASSRHQGKADALFCDGHVESPTLQFLHQDTSDEALSRWNYDHLPHRDRL